MSSGSRRRLVAGLLVGIMIFGAIAPAVLTGGIRGSATSGVAGATSVDEMVFAATTPADNESIQHENPDEAGEDGDTASIQGWLLGRISERLEGSTRNITQGQYDAAEGVIDNETREYLDRYVDVAGETDDEEDDRVAETINETVEQQREFARTRQNFSETYEAYQQARENGNLSRARQLGRQLAGLERELNRTGRNLTRSYRTFRNRTGTNVNDNIETINETIRNTSEIGTQVREELFEETRVLITSFTPNASPRDPLVVRGRVVTENGTPVTGGVVRLRGAFDATAGLNETGYFTLRHRPVLLSRGATNVSLQYRPAVESPYLASTSAVVVTISGGEPTLELSEVPGSVGFGENLTLRARLTLGDRPIEGVPIDTTLGGEGVSATVTQNGTTTISGVVPATVEDGQATIGVTLPISGRAIASTNATRTIQVRETGTRLTTEVTALSSTRVRIRGRLEATNGMPVPNQPIRLRIGGEAVEAATTNATGMFAVTRVIPAGVDATTFEEGRVPVNATFGEPTTNLEGVNATQSVVLSSGVFSGDNGLFGLGVPWWAWGVLLALGLAGLGVGRYIWLTRQESEPVGERSDGDDETPAPATPSGSDEEGNRNRNTPQSLLAAATERLAAGAADAATETSYEAVRSHLAKRLGVTAGTHWELYRASQAADWPEEQVATVRRLTEAYEQAAFAPGSLSPDTAGEAIETARDLLDENDAASGSD